MLKYLLSMFLVCMPMLTFAEEYVAGKDYVVISSRNQQDNTDQVKITEFFSYGCPWCYRIEPTLNQWVTQKGTEIAYNKIPVVFNKDWEYYARAYYTAEALELGSQLTPVLFKAILTDKVSLNNNQGMIDFFIKQGVDATTAHSAFNHSPSIDIEINDGKRLMADYQVNAVPALVVNNKYKTDLQMAKTEERLFAILDFLVKKANTEAKS